MKNLLLVLIALSVCITSFAQIDTDQLSLDISKAEAANQQQLETYMWKRVAVTTVDGVQKLTNTADVKFNEKGELDVQVIDSDTDVKQKRGIRGKVQANTVENNMEYVQEALKLAISYTYMTKGQLIDFFGKAKITENNGIIQAAAGDVFMKGDSLTVFVESDTKLFTGKKFSSFFGKDNDPVSGEVQYVKFSTGVSHPAGSVLTLPKKKAVITSKNQDYSKRVQ